MTAAGQPLPILWIVVPCYNEEQTLPLTGPLFADKVRELVEARKVSARSRVCLVDDGSTDGTWEAIRTLS